MNGIVLFFCYVIIQALKQIFRKRNNMATRSMIGLLIPDHGIVGMYCHYDGYFDGVGKTLLDHYNTYDQVHELIALSSGAISSLGNEIGPLENMDANDRMDKNYCVFYKKNLEDYNTVTFYDELFYTDTQFYNSAKNLGCEYAYLFKDNEWVSTRLRS